MLRPLVLAALLLSAACNPLRPSVRYDERACRTDVLYAEGWHGAEIAEDGTRYVCPR